MAIRQIFDVCFSSSVNHLADSLAMLALIPAKPRDAERSDRSARSKCRKIGPTGVGAPFASQETCERMHRAIAGDVIAGVFRETADFSPRASRANCAARGMEQK
jgi:hypothetical protein